jgi:hypothetical protein
MQRFKSVEQAQRFLEPFSAVCNHFRPQRHRLTATAYRRLMDEQRDTRRELRAGNLMDAVEGDSAVFPHKLCATLAVPTGKPRVNWWLAGEL